MIGFRSVALVLALAPAMPRLGRAQQPRPDTADASKVGRAETAVRRWLALVDSSKYSASWDSAAAMFRAQVTRAAWQDALVAARLQVNPLGTRTLKGAQLTRQLPQAPPGEYAVLQYAATGREDRDVVETVVLVLEPDTGWRVAGYFIKPA